jgi:hypothetical protein
MAGLHDEETGESVEVAPPPVVPDVAALAPHDHGHVRGVGVLQGREVHPEVVARGFLTSRELLVDAGGAMGVERGVGHGSSDHCEYSRRNASNARVEATEDVTIV